jgi:mannitol/fructose-specific phosphotransferase system IIA component (Ntr-type)
VLKLIRHVSSPNHVVLVSSSALEGAVEEILDRLIPEVDPHEKRSVCELVLRREKLRPTVFSHGVAFPRAESDMVSKVVCGVGISDQGIEFGNGSTCPVHTMFVCLYPRGRFDKFLPVLKSLVHFSQDSQKMTALRNMPRNKKEFNVIRQEIFPWGARELMHSHLLLPALNFRNRIGGLVKVRHD